MEGWLPVCVSVCVRVCVWHVCAASSLIGVPGIKPVEYRAQMPAFAVWRSVAAATFVSCSAVFMKIWR